VADVYALQDAGSDTKNNPFSANNAAPQLNTRRNNTMRPDHSVVANGRIEVDDDIFCQATTNGEARARKNHASRAELVFEDRRVRVADCRERIAHCGKLCVHCISDAGGTDTSNSLPLRRGKLPLSISRADAKVLEFGSDSSGRLAEYSNIAFPLHCFRCLTEDSGNFASQIPSAEKQKFPACHFRFHHL
jgi:hypothetical protein